MIKKENEEEQEMLFLWSPYEFLEIIKLINNSTIILFLHTTHVKDCKYMRSSNNRTSNKKNLYTQTKHSLFKANKFLMYTNLNLKFLELIIDAICSSYLKFY